MQARERATMLVVVPARHVARHGPGRRPATARRDARHAGPRGRRPRALATGVRRRGWQAGGVLDPGGPAPCAISTAHLIRYDLTSDLDLALSDSPRASDRKAVLLAGSLRWVSRPLARRLRRYVQDGGHLATFGPETLRRGVTVRANAGKTAGELLRPTQPSAQDPFGARVEPLRRAKAPEAIAQLGGDPAYGLFEGTGGTLDGFSTFEESVPPEEGGKATLLGAMGVAPPEPDPEGSGRRAAAGGALRADRDAAGREGADPSASGCRSGRGG